MYPALELIDSLTDIHGRTLQLGDPVRFLRGGVPTFGTVEDCTQEGEQPYIGIGHSQGTDFMRFRPEHYIQEWGVEVLDCSPPEVHLAPEPPTSERDVNYVPDWMRSGRFA